MKYVIPEITAETIVSCIEALSKKDGDLEYLKKYTDRSPNYVKRAVIIGEQLQLFQSEGVSIKLSQGASFLLKQTGNSYFLAFRDALFNYKPFIFFIDRIIDGDQIETAIRKLKAFFEIESNEKTIQKTFTNFAKSVEIQYLSKESLMKIFPREKEQYQYINKVIVMIHDNFEGQIFLSEKLGYSCFSYISDSERALLVGALMKVDKEAMNAIEDAAGAFESFLRRTGSDNSIDLLNCNGIDEIGQTLASKMNHLILPEHRKLCAFISTFRNPAVHKVHKQSLEHWKIKNDSSIEIILLTLTVMRSIYCYVFEKRLIL